MIDVQFGSDEAFEHIDFKFCPLVAGNARNTPVPDLGLLLHKSAGVPDRVHGRLHAVHQHCSPLCRGDNKINTRYGKEISGAGALLSYFSFWGFYQYVPYVVNTVATVPWIPSVISFHPAN